MRATIINKCIFWTVYCTQRERYRSTYFFLRGLQRNSSQRRGRVTREFIRFSLQNTTDVTRQFRTETPKKRMLSQRACDK